MTIHISTKYLVYGGLAIAAGLAFWYLKSNGIWDQWFNAKGELIPCPPKPQLANPQQGFSIPGSDAVTPASGYVN